MSFVSRVWPDWNGRRKVGEPPRDQISIELMAGGMAVRRDDGTLGNGGGGQNHCKDSV